MPDSYGEVHVKSIAGKAGDIILSELGLSAVALSGNYSDLQSCPTLLSAGTNSASGSITRAAATSSGTQSISLAFQPSFVLFNGSIDADINTYSNGWDDGTSCACAAASTLSVVAVVVSLLAMKQSNSIYIVNALGNGRTAIISAKSTSGFTLNWTKVGSGQAMTVKYLAVK